MALTPVQNNFLWLFVTAGNFDLVETSRQLGILTTDAMRWFLDPEFNKGLGQAQRLRFTLLGVNPYRTVAELSAIAYSNITDLVRIDEAGSFCVRPFNEVPERVLLAVQSVKLKRTSNGSRDNPVFEDVIEIKMHDKCKALTALAEIQGVKSLELGVASTDTGPRRVAGLMVTPPRTAESLE
jgi:hypothetical protein